MGVEILGTLQEFIQKATKYVDDALKESVIEQVAAVVATAKEYCPVGGEITNSKAQEKYGFRPGLMRDSIVGVVNKDGKKGIVKVPAKPIYYSFMVHFGTEKQAAQPFLYRAAEQHSAGFKNKIEAKIKANAS